MSAPIDLRERIARVLAAPNKHFGEAGWVSATKKALYLIKAEEVISALPELDEIPVLREQVARAAALIRDLTDPEDCDFDHNGSCQAHGYFYLRPGELCPMAEAKRDWVPLPASPTASLMAEHLEVAQADTTQSNQTITPTTTFTEQS